MPIGKVNRNYQVTIPKDLRRRAKIGREGAVSVEQDEGLSMVGDRREG